MTFELIQSDYYEELGKTNFAKDLREENYDDLDWVIAYNFTGIGGHLNGGKIQIGGSHFGFYRVGDNTFTVGDTFFNYVGSQHDD